MIKRCQARFPDAPPYLVSRMACVLLMGALMTLICGCVHTSQLTFSCEGVRPNFTLPVSALDGASIPYAPMTGAGAFDTYVKLSLDYPPFHELTSQVAKNFDRLQNRGEAHVTVVTPVEYHEVLQKYLTADEMHKIAVDSHLQNAKIKAVCIGKGTAAIDGKEESTYFVVIQSDDLLEYRNKLFDAYRAHGGPPEKFDPKHFFPHITLGFTKRDLHEADGVQKDVNSCVANVQQKH